MASVPTGLVAPVFLAWVFFLFIYFLVYLFFGLVLFLFLGLMGLAGYFAYRSRKKVPALTGVAILTIAGTVAVLLWLQHCIHHLGASAGR
ncbi:MAG: hypothetical protein QHH75_11390 [Bacillota bacterium]|nr:hypothetical protein [Bacillota bacterium]